MRTIARALITPAALFVIVSVAACGENTGRDGSMTTTDAVSASNAPPPAPMPAIGTGSADEGAMAARREMAEQRKMAATSGAIGVAVGAPMAPDQQAGADPLQGIGQFNPGGPSMLIRTGQAFIEVEALDPAILKVRQLVAQVGGFIANSSITGGREQIRQATFELKVPAGKYDETVGSLDRIGKVETVSSSAQDVGEEFVDVTARVANARRLEERLLSLLANRTGRLEDVLRVERELARVREEIERYEGRLRYLSSRIATSTLTITIHEPGPIFGSNPGDNPIGAAVRRAWRNFVGLIAGLIASLGILIPLGALAFVGWIGYRRWRKTRSL